MRLAYRLGELTESEIAPTWFDQFGRWFAAALGEPAVIEANAIQLATVDAAGRPSVRTVLAKGVTDRGLVFYTHYDSPKGRDLQDRPYASAIFAWLPMQRQVRLSGNCRKVSRDETEAYFTSRPRGSQVGAWASHQSEVVAGRAELDSAVAEVERRFAGADTLPPPPNWGGYLLEPEAVEFWQGRDNRMHDRIRYARADSTAENWVTERLAP
ncbi:MAG: pdxH [Pseudonocardiales bacterium]|nr:pdxH [Pseudonocardiales bacterium]